ncbi:MAG: alpha/beta hydrolase fold protein [Myxococcales bacterium]|nr:alpha/beta hydrolase fold protein [Myxococcales bacterium]
MPASRKLLLGTGLSYHLLEWDGGGDHTVILLHGFLDNAWGWEPVVDAGLAAGFHIVAPDLRGHGDSDWLGAGGYYHFPDYLADVHELVSLVGRGRVSLVGHSMGGSVASYYAGSFPTRVHKLALLEGLGPPESGGSMPERIAIWLAAWKKVRERSPKSYATVEEAAGAIAAHDPLVTPEVARFLAEKGTTTALGGRVRFKHDPLHATPGPYGFSFATASQFWSRVRCPTLLVDGAQSVFRHAADEAARRAACFADPPRTATIEGAGHMMQRHQPARVAAVLRSFLEAA